LTESANDAAVHRCVKKVGDDIEQLKFNTAIASMMTLLNELSDTGASLADLKTLLTLLSPFAPHTAQTLWVRLGCGGEAAAQPWPDFDPAKLQDSERTIAVQVNGKLRSTITMPADAADDDVIAAALTDVKIVKLAEGNKPFKSIVIKNKLVNLLFK
jgi:leucyl-tRNA synthetase